MRVLGHLLNYSQARESRLARLAKSIEALSSKDDVIERRAREIAALRARAAVSLHAVCAAFVASLNTLMERPQVTLDPAAATAFDEYAPNLLQINVRGRILQFMFEATPELVSTEDFRVPYTLAGSIRAFNQDLLDKDLIEEQHIFFTFERQEGMWRFFDARTYRSGPFDEDYLVTLMEQLV
jgi:hypothetical protein